MQAAANIKPTVIITHVVSRKNFTEKIVMNKNHKKAAPS